MNSEISPTETRVTRSLRKRLNSTDSELSVDYTPQKNVPVKSQLDPISENAESAQLKKVTRNIEVVPNTPARRVTRRSSDALDLPLALTPTPARRGRSRKSLVISEESSDSVTPTIIPATATVSIQAPPPSTPIPAAVASSVTKRRRRSITVESTVVEEDEIEPTTASQTLPLTSPQTPKSSDSSFLKNDLLVVLTRQKNIEEEIKSKSPNFEYSPTTRSQLITTLNSSESKRSTMNTPVKSSPQKNKTSTPSALSTSLTSQKNVSSKSILKTNDESINNDDDDDKKNDNDKNHVDDDDENSSFVSLVFEFESDGEDYKNSTTNESNKSVKVENNENSIKINANEINNDNANANMSTGTPTNDLSTKKTNFISKSFAGLFSDRTSITNKQLSKSLTSVDLHETSSLDTTLDSLNQSGTNNSSGNISSSQQVTETDELNTSDKEDDEHKNNGSSESIQIDQVERDANKSTSASLSKEQEFNNSEHEQSLDEHLNQNTSIKNKSNTSISGNKVKEQQQSLDVTIGLNMSNRNEEEIEQNQDRNEISLLNNSKKKQRKHSLSMSKHEIDNENMSINNNAIVEDDENKCQQNELNKSKEKKKKRSLSLSKSLNNSSSLIAVDSGVHEPSSSSLPRTSTNNSSVEQAVESKTTTILTQEIPTTDSQKNESIKKSENDNQSSDVVIVKKPRVSYNSVINRCDDLLNQLNETKRQQKILNKPEIPDEKIERIKDKKKQKQIERARREAALLEIQRLEKEKKLKKRLKKEIKQTAAVAASATVTKEINTNTSTKDEIDTTPSSYEETSVIHALKHAVNIVATASSKTNKKPPLQSTKSTIINTQDKNKNRKHKIGTDIDALIAANDDNITVAAINIANKLHNSEPTQKKIKTVIVQQDDQTPSFAINGQQHSVVPKKLILSSVETNPIQQALTAAASIKNKKKKKLSVLDTVKELEKQKQTELTTATSLKKHSKKSSANNDVNSAGKGNPFAKQPQSSKQKEKSIDQQNITNTVTKSTDSVAVAATQQKSKKASFVEQIRASLKSKPSSAGVTKTIGGGVEQKSKKLKKKIEFVERVKQLPKPQWTTAGEFHVSETSTENIYSEGSTTFTVTTLNAINKKKIKNSNSSLQTLTANQSNIINSGAAPNYKQNSMFDGHVQRETSKQMLNRKQKQMLK